MGGFKHGDILANVLKSLEPLTARRWSAHTEFVANLVFLDAERRASPAGASNASSGPVQRVVRRPAHIAMANDQFRRVGDRAK